MRKVSDILPIDDFPLLIDDCIAQTSSTLRFLCSNESEEIPFTPLSTNLYGCVLISDVSGFTRLSTVLGVEELRFHMNNLFSNLLGTIEKYGGDPIKLCGDAILSIWTVPDDSISCIQDAVRKATCCGLDMLEYYGIYENNTKSTKVSLRLHCGLSVGELHCMWLGNEQRMEWLISGPQLRDMGYAANDAQPGQLCVSPEVLKYLNDMTNIKSEKTSKGNFLIFSRQPTISNVQILPSQSASNSTQRNPHLKIASESSKSTTISIKDSHKQKSSSHFLNKKKFSWLSTFFNIIKVILHSNDTHQQKTSSIRINSIHQIQQLNNQQSQSQLQLSQQLQQLPQSQQLQLSQQLAQIQIDDGVSFKNTRRKASVTNASPVDRFIDQSGELCDYKRNILMRFIHECARPHVLLHDTNFLAEIRYVVTIFIELLNLQDDFDIGDIERPQLAMTIVLEVLNKIGGVLRQYVVDDKGCVMICSFGLPNFNSSDNELRAILASLAIMSTLEESDISCRIGISSGNAYCGYVGSTSRKEYCVMGSSVNLAARLMSKANPGQILVSGSVYDVIEDSFTFITLDKIIAKGYIDPIQVYSPIRREYDSTIPKEDFNRTQMIGRQSELSILKAIVSKYHSTRSSIHGQNGQMISSHGNTLLINEYNETNRVLIVAPEGYGKSILLETLCQEVRSLKTVKPVTCHIRMEPYQCLFAIVSSILGLGDPFITTTTTTTTTNNNHNNHNNNNNNILLQQNNSSYNDDVSLYQPPSNDIYEAIADWVQNCNSLLIEESKKIILDDYDDNDDYDINYNNINNNNINNNINNHNNHDEEDLFLQHYNDNNNDNNNDNSNNNNNKNKNNNNGRIERIHQTASVKIDDSNANNDHTQSHIDTSKRAEYWINSTLPSIKLLLTSSVLNLDDSEIIKINRFFLFYLRSMMLDSSIKILLIEDIQWCDPESYNILLQLLKICDNGCFIFTISQNRLPRQYFSRSTSFSGKEVELDSLKTFFKVIELRKFTLSEVKIAIKRILGPTLIASDPLILSEQNILKIFNESDYGIPQSVIQQVKTLMISLKSRNSLSTPTINKPLWETDVLDLKWRIVLKVASVCGSIFSSSLVVLTLEDLGYKDVADSHITIFSELQKRRLIRSTYSNPPYIHSHYNTTRSSLTRPSISSPSLPPSPSSISSPLSPSPVNTGIDLSTSGLRGSSTYCFVEKAILENIYGSLLDSQREAMHASIAQYIENDYKNNPKKYNYNVSIYLANNWDKSGENYIHKKVEYFQKAAIITHEKNLLSDSRLYYEQLISMSFNGNNNNNNNNNDYSSVEELLKQYYTMPICVPRSQKIYSEDIYDNNNNINNNNNNNKISTRSSSSSKKLRCSLSISTFYLHNYMYKDNFVGKFTLNCQYINNIQLTIYFFELSAIEYNRHSYILSRNLFEFAFFIGGLTLHFAIKLLNLNVFTHIFSNLQIRRLLCLNFSSHAFLSLLRGRFNEANNFSEISFHLINYNDINVSARVLSLHAIILLCLGNSSKSYKLWKKAKKIVAEQQIDPIILSYIHLYCALRHVFIGEFSQAEVVLSLNRSRKVDTTDIFLTSCKSLEAWISFLTGNCRRVESFTIPSSASMTDNISSEFMLHDCWSRQLRVIINLLKGNFTIARKELYFLESLQLNHQKGLIHTTCLNLLIEMCEKHFLTVDIARKYNYITQLIHYTNKLTLINSSNIISFIMLFFMVYCTEIILEHLLLTYSNEERKETYQNYIKRLIISINNIIPNLLNYTKVFKFIEIFIETLKLKFSAIYFRYKLIFSSFVEDKLLSSIQKFILPQKFYLQIPTKHIISTYPECSFGIMFWNYEMFINLQYLQINAIFMDECRRNTLNEMKKYNIPSDHLFHTKL